MPDGLIPVVSYIYYDDQSKKHVVIFSWSEKDTYALECDSVEQAVEDQKDMIATIRMLRLQN